MIMCAGKNNRGMIINCSPTSQPASQPAVPPVFVPLCCSTAQLYIRHIFSPRSEEKVLAESNRKTNADKQKKEKLFSPSAVER